MGCLTPTFAVFHGCAKSSLWPGGCVWVPFPKLARQDHPVITHYDSDPLRHEAFSRNGAL